jgi:hypothetical protein
LQTTNLAFGRDCLSLNMKFPVYRKYLNEMSYFRIDSPEKFEEIRRIGSRLLITAHEVKILPERNMVHDLLHDYKSFAVEIFAEEYNQIAQNAAESGRN